MAGVPSLAMATEVLRMLDRGAQHDELERAGAILREGGLVAFEETGGCGSA